MGAVWAWMSRPDVVLCVSITAIVLSLAGMAVTAMMEQRRG
jgi:hypothetical protein